MTRYNQIYKYISNNIQCKSIMNIIVEVIILANIIINGFINQKIFLLKIRKTLFEYLKY